MIEQYYIRYLEGWYPITLERRGESNFILVNGKIPVTQEVIDDYIAAGIIAKLDPKRQFYGVMAQ